jgi:hypothetical protein
MADQQEKHSDSYQENKEAKRLLAEFNHHSGTVTSSKFSLPISNQAHVWQSSSAATEGLSL